MELVQKIDKKCAETLPYYSEVADYTQQAYHYGLDRFNNLYACSSKKAQELQKVKGYLVWLYTRPVEDLLNFIEGKLQISSSDQKKKGTIKRLNRIYKTLKKQNLNHYWNYLVEIKKQLEEKVNGYKQEYLIPYYIKFTATVLVSRQMLMEAFTERISSIKMTYKQSKDTITMFWSGEAKEEKILEAIKENLGSFKQFTINFVQKGLEIKISKADLMNNYHVIMDKLGNIFKEAGIKGAQSWSTTKARAMELYLNVIDRIKAKERQLTQPQSIKVQQTSQVPAVAIPDPKPAEEKPEEMPKEQVPEEPKSQKDEE